MNLHFYEILENILRRNKPELYERSRKIYRSIKEYRKEGNSV